MSDKEVTVMFWKKREETVVVSEVVEGMFGEDEMEDVSQRHCAWCGDPPDEYGSHGICAFHAEQMAQQVQVRRSRRNG